MFKSISKINGYDKDQFDARMERQLDPLEKAKKADYVIVNNKSLDSLYNSVNELYNELTQGLTSL